MDKAVAVAHEDFGGDPHRPRHPVDVQQDRRRLLRRADPVQQLASFTVPEARMVIIKPYDTSAMARHREGDPRLRPRRQPDQRRQDHPRACFPELTEERRKRVRQGRPAPRPRTPGSPSATSAATPRRSSTSSSRTARSARTTSAAPRRSSTTSPQKHVARDRRAAQAQGSRAARGLTSDGSPPMTSPSPPPTGPDPPGPGTERCGPRRPGGARWSSRPRRPPPSDDDTGPVPIVGDRPGPPARRPPAEIPAVSDAAARRRTWPELPTTEQPAGGRAGPQPRRRDRRRARPRRGDRRVAAALAAGVRRRRRRGRARRRRRAHPRPARRAVPAAAGPAAGRRAGDGGPGLDPRRRPAWSSASCSPCSPSCCGGSADGPAGYLRDVSAGVLVALYVPLLAGFAVLLLVPDDGAARVLAFIATVVASDVGGYAAGVLFGKHPMAPSISPKKSWEGFAGSVTACMVVGHAAARARPRRRPGGAGWCSARRSPCRPPSATSASR